MDGSYVTTFFLFLACSQTEKMRAMLQENKSLLRFEQPIRLPVDPSCQVCTRGGRGYMYMSIGRGEGSCYATLSLVGDLCVPGNLS